jgi:photosystem II stability/assembly factor-like uncharacterized protein
VFHSVVNNAQTSNVLAWRSKDGGVTWSTDWVRAPAASLSAGKLTCPTTSRCYATVMVGKSYGVGHNEVMTTSNGGLTWAYSSPIRVGSSKSVYQLNSVDCTSASTCWIGGTAGAARRGAASGRAAIFATINSGRTWTSIPVPTGLGVVFQVDCNPVASCLAVARPPYRIRNNRVIEGPLPVEILSNQSNS